MAPSILIIDDDENLCSILSKFLSKEGYAVQTCASGQKAFKLLGLLKKDYNTYPVHPELIILDIVLPDMLGFEIIKEINKKRHDLMNTPFIIMSGQYIEKDNILEGLHFGAYDYLCKPFDLEILLSKVKNCIDFYHDKNKFDFENQYCEIFDIKDTANYLRLTEKTVYTLVKEGKLPGLKIGGQWRFSKEMIKKIFK